MTQAPALIAACCRETASLTLPRCSVSRAPSGTLARSWLWTSPQWTRVGDLLAGGAAAPAVALDAVRLRSPILQPPTVRDFIVYEEHASSQGTREPNEVWYRMPVFYFSNTLCIYGPDDTVPFPSTSDQYDYEMEIGAVIGKNGSRCLPRRCAIAHCWVLHIQRLERARRPI